MAKNKLTQVTASGLAQTNSIRPMHKSFAGAYECMSLFIQKQLFPFFQSIPIQKGFYI